MDSEIRRHISALIRDGDSSLDLSEVGIDHQDLMSIIPKIGHVTSLNLRGNQLSALPEAIADCTRLTTLHLGDNQLTRLPSAIGRLARLTSLHLYDNRLSALPASLGDCARLSMLHLGGNGLNALPEALRDHTALTTLYLYDNCLVELPEWIGRLSRLTTLGVSKNQLARLPDSIGELISLTTLYLDENRLTTLPATIGRLTALTSVYLNGNRLTSLPDSLGNLRSLTNLDLSGNRLTVLPPSLGDLPTGVMNLAANPLAPELEAAYRDSSAELTRFLRLLKSEGRFSYEAKLVLVGEGGVGKSSLLSALRDEEWVEGRTTTHGIEVKPLRIDVDGTDILLNGWDFGGQPIYRPTHQLFFSAPAVYLVVWKPREGPEQGSVDYWIRLIKHRAGTDARIFVVATHGGPRRRSAYLDEATIVDEYGDMIVGFHHVDSMSRFGIAELLAGVGATAAVMPHAGRWYPASWERLLAELRGRSEPYLNYGEYEAIAERHGLTETAGQSLAKMSNTLGQWIYYADDPNLSDLLILKADWLATAVSFVLDDPVTIRANGLLPHRRLPLLWNSLERPAENRYTPRVQQTFLQLMERFDISYRVTDGSDHGEPLSLVAQLVRTDRPDLSAWTSYGEELPEGVQVCEIVETATGAPALPEGLMYQLIVRFHRFSLGRSDFRASVHWRSGMVLDNSYNGRALITIERNRVTVRVRAAYPQFLLHQVSDDIRQHLQGFWKGLEGRIKIPCGAGCSVGRPGTGLFDIDKLAKSREQQRAEFPCMECGEWQNIDALLLGVTVRSDNEHDRLVHAVRDAVEPQFAHVLEGLESGTQTMLGAMDSLEMTTRSAISRAEERLRDLVVSFDDESRDGPRLFTVALVGSTVLRPGWLKQHVRLTVWCEHSRLPVPLLNGEETAGVYDLDLPRKWLVAAAPWIRAVSVVIRCLLPVSLAAAQLDLGNRWQAIGLRMAVAEKTLAGLTDLGDQVSDTESGPIDENDLALTLPDSGSPPVHSAFLRSLHAYLQDEDPTFARLGLVRVRVRNRYLWVHPQFVEWYHQGAPHIPTDPMSR